MLVNVTGCVVVGLAGEPVSVEVDIAPIGLSAFNIVGHPGAVAQEVKELVRAAIRNVGGPFPQSAAWCIWRLRTFAKNDPDTICRSWSGFSSFRITYWRLSLRVRCFSVSSPSTANYAICRASCRSLR